MFKIGKVINFYEKIGITIVSLSGNLAVGDTIKIFKDGEEILSQSVDKIILDRQNIPFAKAGDVVGLLLDVSKKIQKGSEVYRQGVLGTR